ncbi:hypothetical protein GCM10011371_24740 [Novosphingobium marinum]|uniref:Lipoprotein n=1 Tax=Novosphingobium marinum TaxID=1514948 RepID=A0A7Y9XXZ4_9SPHN|nr:hypothetical protein [Novosphingobium marinum]NYH96587.1 hypothetical protein [Novosphingobium marinum]GGC36374.1 hypothetical protein GCM10011371_24740 [Novosphingobium marinum]
MKHFDVKRAAPAIAAVAGLLLLAGCLLAPGRFGSELDLRQDGRFAFRYTGELYLLPLAKKPDGAGAFEPEECDDDGETRACTEAEIAAQREDWERSRASKAQGEAEMAKAFLGGLDPSDPKAAQEFAERLRRQAGWRKVEYRGDGRFDVDFAINGTLDHDFVFPTIERFPMANAFVTLSLRDDGTVRIDAPGFGPGGSGMPMQGLMMAAAAAAEEQGGKTTTNLPEMEGTFVVRTDGEIRANNTEEGPAPDPSGQVMTWEVSSAGTTAPTALVQLAPRTAR